jgi:hypothetical protein
MKPRCQVLAVIRALVSPAKGRLRFRADRA